jgi:DNA (cytosine-5)-methyltransferase 1
MAGGEYMNIGLPLQNPLEGALPQQKKSITSTETRQITDCPICYSFQKPNIMENTELRLKLSERKCSVCGKNCGKPALLDLFSGGGGAARGYQKAGFCVLGVDIKPQPHYAGCRFVQADALTYPLEGFDAYHASPPCQKFSKAVNVRVDHIERRHKHPDLIDATRVYLLATAKPFVIENVPASPLEDYIKLHGTMFGLKTNKERWFELHGFEILLLPARHSSTKGKVKSGEFVGIMQHSKYPNERYRKDELAAGYEIEWGCTRHELRQAIPPAYTEYIGKYLMAAIKVSQ